MNEERICSLALEHPTPQRRARFLDRVCGEDLNLRSRVEALLAAHQVGDELDELVEAAEQVDVEYRADDTVGQSSPDDSLAPDLMQVGDSSLGDELTGGSHLSHLSAVKSPKTAQSELWTLLLKVNDVSRLGLTLGDYELVKVLGRGGMGLVLQAVDSKLNRNVALKVLSPSLLTHSTACKRFVREAKAVAAISHDNVVSIHAINENALPPMIVMEFVDGVSLEQEIKQSRGSLSVQRIVDIATQIAAGLAAAHERGLIHRDIKPSNILIQQATERIKLTDFGLARAVDDVSLTKTGQVFGTPLYMSPEQSRGQRVDHRTDLFSLGGVMYAMCTGKAAFRADSAVAVIHRVIHDDPRAVEDINPDIPIWLSAVIDKLLEKDPNERFASAEEVLEQLQSFRRYLAAPDQMPRPIPVATSRRDGPELERHIRRNCNYVGLVGGLSIVWGVLGLVTLQPALNALFISLYLSTISGILGLFGAYQMLKRTSHKSVVIGTAALLLPANPFSLLGIWKTYKILRKFSSDEIKKTFKPQTWLEMLKLPAAFLFATASLYILGMVILTMMSQRTDVSRIRTIENDGNTTIIYLDR